MICDPPMKPTINVAVVGCGYWGPNLARVFSMTPGSRLHTCCDLNTVCLDRMRALYPYIKTRTSYKDLLDDKEIDAIVLAVPVKHHHILAKGALLSGKHVLVEKPMTMTSAESEDLISSSKKSGKVLMVDHTFEYTPAVRKMKEIIDKGDLGDVYYINTYWQNLGLLQPDVNVVFDLATHVFSTINYITGSLPVSVRATGEKYVRSTYEEMAHIIIRYPNKIIASVNVSWLEPCKVREMTIIGSRKMLLFDNQNQAEQIKVYDKGVDINDLDNKISYRSGDIYSPKISVEEPLMEEAKHFIDCIKNNKRPLTDGSVGLRVVRILESVNQSLQDNGAEILL